MKPTSTPARLAALVLGVAATVTTFSGCSPANTTETTSGEAMTMSNCGKNTTFTTPPSKVLSLGVSGLAYLYAAGAKEKIVARANGVTGEPAGLVDGRRCRRHQDRSRLGHVRRGGDRAATRPGLRRGVRFLPAPTRTPDREGHSGGRRPTRMPLPLLRSEEDESFDAILTEVSRLGKVLGTSDKAEAESQP